MRWWTSCCRQQAWRPRWRHAQRYLGEMLELEIHCRGADQLTIDERVQNGHGTVGDTSVGVNLLEDWIDASVLK